LSSGNAGTEAGRAIGKQMESSGATGMADDFLQGERYLKTPQVAAKFVDNLPIVDIPAKYVVVKPLRDVTLERDNVRSITFFVNSDQLAALVVLANYEGAHNENVTVPFAAGCQAAGICTYHEYEKEHPRAVIGLMDLSARENIRKQLGKDAVSFSVTPSKFLQMERNVEGSFLQRNTWKSLVDQRQSERVSNGA
jgi:hypothetical protein